MGFALTVSVPATTQPTLFKQHIYWSSHGQVLNEGRLQAKPGGGWSILILSIETGPRFTTQLLFIPPIPSLGRARPPTEHPGVAVANGVTVLPTAFFGNILMLPGPVQLRPQSQRYIAGMKQEEYGCWRIFGAVARRQRFSKP